MRIFQQAGWWLAGLIVFAAGSQTLVAQRPGPREMAAANRGLIKAPKFDNEILELFATDARTRIGSGEAPGKQKAQPAGSGSGAAPSDAGAPTKGSFAWSKLISPDSLESEVKSLGTVAADAVKTPNNFKSKGREIAQGAFTELAMLFGVISQFDGDVKWKKDSLGLEKAYAQAGNNCKTSSDAAYKEAKKRTEDLGEMLKGGSIGDLPKVDGPGTWHELLNRPVLMKRLEEARQGGKIAKYTANKSEFKKGKDALLREAQVLAVISEVVKDQGFESANDEAYQKYAQAFQGHCLALIEAVKNDDPDKAQAAFAQVSKACDTCHGDFR